MYKAIVALTALFLVTLSGCADPSAVAVSGSTAAPTLERSSPIPEQPGYNRWGTRAPA